MPVVPGVTLWLPLTALVPVHAPDAEHTVVSVLSHVRVEDAPRVMLVGDAERVRVGTGGASTVTLTVLETVPPLPVQAKV